MSARMEGAGSRLADLLADTGWSAEQLARRVSLELGSLDAIHAKTPYGWLRGKQPRPRVAEAVAVVLSARLGRAVDARSIWPAISSSDDAALGADHGLGLPWTCDGLHQLAADWDQMQRRKFLTLSGAALTAPAWAAIEHPAPSLATDRDAERVDEATLQIIEQTVASAQRLDDTRGSSAMRYVIDTAGTVTRILTRDTYDTASGRRLALAVAQLSQTAAFMAYEARSDGLAQRLYLAGLRAAHAAGDSALSASILGLMANQATALGRTEDAVQLASAAQTAARDAPKVAQALIAARAGLARRSGRRHHKLRTHVRYCTGKARHGRFTSGSVLGVLLRCHRTGCDHRPRHGRASSASPGAGGPAPPARRR